MNTLCLNFLRTCTAVSLLLAFGMGNGFSQTADPGRVILPASFRVEVAQITDDSGLAATYEMSLDQARFGLSVNNTTRYLYFEFDITPLQGKSVCGVRLRVFNHGRANTIHNLSYAPFRPQPLYPIGGLLLFGSASGLNYNYSGVVNSGNTFEWSVNGDDQWSPSLEGFFPEDPYQMILWRRNSDTITIVEDLNRHIQNPGIDWFALRFAGTGTGEGRVNLRFDDNPTDPSSIVLEVLTMDIDLLETQNAAFHHTSEYELEDTLVVRRATAGQQPVEEQSHFKVGLTTGLPIDRSKMFYQIEAMPLFDSPEDKIIIADKFAEGLKPAEWGMNILEEGSEKKVVINIPHDAAVGKYRFKFQAFLADAPQQPLCEVPFKKDILVLFNPWSKHDRVYMSQKSLDTWLLVKNQKNNLIYRGANTSIPPKPYQKKWKYSEFHETTMEVLLSLLDRISFEARRNPYQLVRELTPFLNARDEDGGIIEGKWEGDTSDGFPAESWEGTLPILETYKISGPVKYGQCWVFSGVLVSFLRALGIPSRPVTCWNSGWEKMEPVDKHVEVTFDDDENIIPGISDVSWTYHVWVEAWISFAGLNQHDWNVLDATPMNPSTDGLHRYGPARVSDIKATDLNQSGLDYDVDFIDTAVDGIIVRHNYPRHPGPDPNFLGEAIWANENGLRNIILNYKTPNKPSQLPNQKSLALAEIDAVYISPSEAKAGDVITWSVTLTNQSQEIRQCTVWQGIRRASYRGDLFEFLAQRELVISLNPGETETVSLSVDEVDYLGAINYENNLYGRTNVTVHETKEKDGSESRLIVFGPDLNISVNPDPPIIKVDDQIIIDVQFTNSLSIPLTGVVANLGFSGDYLGFGSEAAVQEDLGDIQPGETISFSIEADGLSPGKDRFDVTVFSNELLAFDGSLGIEVYEDCNENGVPDDEDLDLGTSQDCNENDIPDECELASGSRTDVNGNGLLDTCETDCNLNRIPDSWEVQQGLVQDCNGNGIPDSCDITWLYEEPHSTDLNLNRIPDECEPDCNGNGIPDDWEIAQGQTADCNGNGIPDACDIASQNSGDGDGDGVPDECEQPQMIQPAPGSQLGAAEVIFQWDGTNAPFLDYRLEVGSTVGGADLFAGSPLGPVQSQTVGGLPVDGRMLFVRLHFLFDSTWGFIDTSYTAVRLAQLTTPQPGSQLTGHDPVFAWTGNGLAVDEWQLDLGSSSGTNDLHQSGPLAGTTTSHAVSGLPTDGRPIFARLRYTIGATTDDVLATYTAVQLPEITSPAPGSTITSDTATFQWVDNGASVTDWQLLVGTAQGGSNVFNSGVLPFGTESQTVTGMPLDGSTLFVRLRYRIGGNWSQRDVTYTADRRAQLIAPTNYQLTSDTATFQWTANGLSINRWRLEIGTSQGASDIYQSGILAGTTLSQTVANLPADGRVLYIRLSSRIQFSWTSADTTYQALGDPLIVAPEPGGFLPGFAADFEMDTRGSVVDLWTILAGSTQGSQDYFASNSISGTLRTLKVSNLPTDGNVVWIRFRYRINGNWDEKDYQYTASSVPGGPTFTNPVPGSVLPGFATQFTYTNDGGVIGEWEIHAGSSQGSDEYFNSRNVSGTNLSMKISNLPTDGSLVWMRLRYSINGNWYARDFQYTASSVPGGPTFTNPVPGSVLPGFATQFTYTNDGGDIGLWEILAGSTQGGTEYFDSRHVGGNALSMNVSNLPTDGSLVWIRLRYNIEGTWYDRDFQYTASSVPGGPTFTNPVPGSVLPGFATQFTYTNDGGDIDEWEIFAGSVQGAFDYFDSPYVSGNALSMSITNLPTDGSIVWVRLRYNINGNWYDRDFQYIAFGEPGGPTISAPVSGSSLPGSTASFSLDARGESVEFWQLYAGSTIGGSEHGTSALLIGTATMATLTNLPTDGSTVYVQLRYRINGTWQWRDFTFEAATAKP